MDGPEPTLRVTERLYAAALEPGEWPNALAAVANLLGGDHITLVAAEPDRLPFAAYAGIDERDFVRSLSAHQACNVGPVSYDTIPMGKAVLRGALISDSEFERSTYYNEVVRPLGGFYSVVAREENASASFVLVVCRPRWAEDFEDGATKVLQHLLPHVSTALALHWRLRVGEQRLHSMTQVLDRLADGVILTNSRAQPLFLNKRATEIVAEGDGLVVDACGLAASTKTDTQRLRDAVAAAGAMTNGTNGGGLHFAHDSNRHDDRSVCLARPSGQLPLRLTLLPVWRLGLDLPATSAPRVAVFIRELAAAVAIDRRALADVLRLTSRETDIAVLLAQGLDLGTIATALGLGLGTVRFHLKHVFEKTRTHSQPALVAMLHGFAGRDR